ncbi:MAG: CPBP family intramembrane metalloprotease [Candidatus Thorarchaeota archaeon]|nr:CPBP family intramembrane metalloprotease [Candidatus Thorarchaeota archaeon]
MTVVGISQQPEAEEQQHLLSRIGLLPLAGLLFAVAVVWRFVDVVVLHLGDSWLNIMPSKLFPLLIIVGAFWKYRRTEVVSVLGLSKGKFFKTQMILGVVLSGTWYLLLDVIPQVVYATFFDSAYQLGFQIADADLLFYSLIFFITNGFLEEILFRGVLQNSFRMKIGVVGGIVLSGVLFGVWHAIWPIINGIDSLFSVGQAVSMVVFSAVFGTLYGVYYEKFSSGRTLVALIVSHTFMDFVNEHLKFGPELLVPGPDYVYTNPSILGITILFFLIGYFAMILFFWKFKVEDVNEKWSGFVSHLKMRFGGDSI